MLNRQFLSLAITYWVFASLLHTVWGPEVTTCYLPLSPPSHFPRQGLSVNVKLAILARICLSLSALLPLLPAGVPNVYHHAGILHGS